MDNPPADVALGPGMSVVPTVRVDSTSSLVEKLRNVLVSTAVIETDAPRGGGTGRQSLADRHPGRARELYEVLDTTIANRALKPYIAGGYGGERGRSLLGGTTYLVAKRHHPDSVELSGENNVRPQSLLPDLSWTFHLKLAA